MSNVLAAIGRGQLHVLRDRVQSKRDLFKKYKSELLDLPGINFMPEPTFGYSTRWLTCLTIDPALSGGVDRDDVINALMNENIEARPTWETYALTTIIS